MIKMQEWRVTRAKNIDYAPPPLQWKDTAQKVGTQVQMLAQAE